MEGRGIAAVVFVVLAASCGSPTAEEESDELDRFKQETAQRLQEITEELEGLDLDQRRSRLTELAQEEGATLDFYGVTNVDDMTPVFEAFDEETGVTVNYYKAGAEDILQRLIEEARAGFRGTDFINDPDTEMTVLDREGLLAEVETPVADQITPEGVQRTWFWAYLDIFAASWNTDELAPDEVPASWEDVLTKYPGRLALEVSDFDWFATLVTDHFMAEEGMTEDEAVDLFRTAARGARIINGHTLMTELLAAGEFAVAASPFTHRVDQFNREGASIEWEPAVLPLVAKGDGVGIHAAARHPATALLFLEFLLTDAQAIGVELNRQPASTEIPGGGIPSQYSTLTIGADVAVDDVEKWQSLYDEILQLSGEDVIED
jgi:iron(III) transport system substrate-binding protein